jgi:hypothetical protein
VAQVAIPAQPQAVSQVVAEAEEVAIQVQKAAQNRGAARGQRVAQLAMNR